MVAIKTEVTNKGVVSRHASESTYEVKLPRLSRYQFVQHTAGATQTLTASFAQIQIDGGSDHASHNLNLWNTASSIFYPERVGTCYMLRFDGQCDVVGGQPVVHVDLILSGSDPDVTPSQFRHHQSVETVIRSSNPHQHIHGIYTLFTDEALYVSGAIFVAETSGPSIDLFSASVTIHPI